MIPELSPNAGGTYRAAHLDRALEVKICESCGHEFLRPIPDAEAVHQILAIVAWLSQEDGDPKLYAAMRGYLRELHGTSYCWPCRTNPAPVATRQ